MQIESRLRPDLWKAIQAHYERKDYTEAVRDALFHVCELLREKSGLENVDGAKLVNDALLGNNPALLINRNETTTEKDIQQGIGFAFKGLMQAIRNPLSHENMNYTQNDAESIILYINYLLNQVDRSGGYTKIHNITALLYDRDFTPTVEYAELFLKEIPVKKRYDLLVELFQKRSSLPQHTLTIFIRKLYDSLTKASKTDFLRIVSGTLMTCKDDYDLRMYLHYFMKFTYPEVDRLAQLRMEEFVLRSIRKGCMESVVEGANDEIELECNQEGSLATWICGEDRFQLLTNGRQLRDALFMKLSSEESGEEEFVFEYFQSVVLGDLDSFSDFEIRVLNSRLKAGDKLVYNALSPDIEFFKDEAYIQLFGEAFEECTEILKKRAERDALLPF